jgi:hypothetical protein
MNVRLDDQSSFVTTELISNDLFKGQTSIIRFKLTFLNINAFYNVKLKITSTFDVDSFDLQKFFISNIGDNLPCVDNENQVDFFYG